MNPASLMRMMTMKAKFEKNHPKFIAFIQAVFSRPIEEGTVIEITVKRPGEDAVTANISVTKDDIEMFNEMKTMS
ncbi:MAG: hypothetical protein IJ195_00350 [Lachnospiraceae bacterium]|nr:hypothetical protein [Lachnospiraceae bacterium]MBQ8137884.1 hypothetical protein [Lachnospiraceae bacterium]MBR1650769.1 hypothetical protein [Lachnospiraceae bacterium]